MVTDPDVPPADETARPLPAPVWVLPQITVADAVTVADGTANTLVMAKMAVPVFGLPGVTVTDPTWVAVIPDGQGTVVPKGAPETDDPAVGEINGVTLTSGT
jgi:hypothetical protein